MDIQERITQFQNMCREDPDNDMAWFSLGGAYDRAGQPREAAQAYMRCIQANESMSKAYQLAGEAFMAAGQQEQAIDVLTRGSLVAASRGDLMPRNAMAQLLQELGAPVPEAPPGPIESIRGGDADGSFICRRTGRPGTRMDRPPFRGPVGEWIAQNIAKETFDAWLAQGTKVINELRLDLSRDEDAEVYDEHMREFLGIDADLYARLVESKPTA